MKRVEIPLIKSPSSSGVGVVTNCQISSHGLVSGMQLSMKQKRRCNMSESADFLSVDFLLDP